MKQVVLITGVAGGIGYGAATVFQQNGWYVIGLDVKPNVGSLEAVDLYVHADASDPEHVRRAKEQIISEVGRVDALVNNAAIQFTKPMLEMSIHEWDLIMNVNVRSAFLFIQAFFELLRDVEGSIINVSSVHAVATSADIAAYATSKGALMALTRASSIELAQHNIRVNAVLPGAVDTPMLRSGLSRSHVGGATIKERIDDLASKIVMGRVGQPIEIGESILFLADKKRSGYMTGQALIIDGGATTRLSTE